MWKLWSCATNKGLPGYDAGTSSPKTRLEYRAARSPNATQARPGQSEVTAVFPIKGGEGNYDEHIGCCGWFSAVAVDFSDGGFGQNVSQGRPERSAHRIWLSRSAGHQRTRHSDLSHG